MKKRTRKKLSRTLGSIFKFCFKLIFIYPFQLVWWIIKHIFQAIKEVIQKARKNKKEQLPEKSIKTKSAKEEQATPKTPPKQGKIKSDPQNDPFKELKKKTGSLEKFNTLLYTNPSTIGLILGARGTGKSAIGMRILENFHTQSEKVIYALGFKPSALPKYITVIKDINDIENNAVLLVDEGGIEFSSRKSMSDANTLLSQILLIARHKDLSVIFITQNSSNIEVNAIRQADYLLLKPSSLLQIDFERKKIQDIYKKAKNEFEDLQEDKGLTFVYASNYHGFISNSLPSFWSEKVSKGYASK